MKNSTRPTLDTEGDYKAVLAGVLARQSIRAVVRPGLTDIGEIPDIADIIELPDIPAEFPGYQTEEQVWFASVSGEGETASADPFSGCAGGNVNNLL